jgi:hypothetical protein
MPSPLFQFQLQPLDQIQPWGRTEDPNLHWFGLTDGLYWIQVGHDKLFEYSSDAQARCGVAPFCEYQVVRLYEDVIGLAPYALEPVPEDLQRYLAPDESVPWNHHWIKWCESVDTVEASEDSMNMLDDAGPWIGHRTLDCAYLAPSANIMFWSDNDSVRVQWTTAASSCKTALRGLRSLEAGTCRARRSWTRSAAFTIDSWNRWRTACRKSRPEPWPRGLVSTWKACGASNESVRSPSSETCASPFRQRIGNRSARRSVRWSVSRLRHYRHINR